MKRMLLLAAAAALLSQPDSRRAGPQRHLPTGQLIRPAGRQIALDTFPMAAVLTPDKRHLLILHGGAPNSSLAVFDAASMNETSRVGLDGAWLGVAVHPNGHTVYAGGGASNRIREFTLSDEGRLESSRAFEVVAPQDRKSTDFVGDLVLSPDGRLLYIADLAGNAIKVINPQSGRVIENWKTARRPYRILFHSDGRSFFVSSWADGVIIQHDSQNGTVINRALAGPHPTDMVWREKKTSDEEGQSEQFAARIFVTLGNTNTVRVFGVSESKELKAIETINLSLYADSPAGMTPSALALSPDQNTLFVACSDANAVAAVNIAGSKSSVIGFAPTGWYPTAVRALDERQLAVLTALDKDVQTGAASIIETGSPAAWIDWTEQVRRNTPYTEQTRHIAHHSPSLVIPQNESGASPVQHVVYIVKESLPYDQVFGDVLRGNASSGLTRFPQRVTPNHHKLASEFVLFDNFHATGKSTLDGLSWSVAAIAPDFIQRILPFAREREEYLGDPAALPPAGYLWTNAMAKGLRVRNYGLFAVNRPLAEVNDNNQIARFRDPALAPNSARGYRGFDPEYLDVDRAKAFLIDLARMEGEKQFPRLAILRLGNDSNTLGKRSPQARVADNDAALGMIVEALTRSSFWPKMAIFVLEASGGRGDHVGPHRVPAFVISPYTKRGVLDSTFYNTASMLRTMELILGLSPMTMHDAGAAPMVNAFTDTPELKGFTAERPAVSLEGAAP
ncbi:MAG: hypothetical protein HYX27_16635 [Acidobacteria bacterium]|nr:hypothetical protein [Acidobacteriota bacterium]